IFILDTANGKRQRLRKPKLHSNAVLTIWLLLHASLLCTSTSHPPHLKKQNIQQSNIHHTFSLYIMVKVTVEAYCRNAPRKEFRKQFRIALANSDSNFVIENIIDNIHWEIVGNHTITNKEEFEKRILDSPLWNVKELVIDAIITHGNEASANGTVVTSDDLKFAFCNVYKFKGFKGTLLKSIQTYLIEF